MSSYFRGDFLLAGLAALCLFPCNAKGQGPSVEIFTSRNDTSGVDSTTLWRLPASIVTSVSSGYDDNVATTSSEEGGSFFANASISVNYSFGTQRTRANVSTSASLAYYLDDQRSGFHYDPNLFLHFGLSHQVSERLGLTSTLLTRYGIEPDFAIIGARTRRSGNYFYLSGSISASYQWYERFSTVTTASLGTLRYEEALLAQFQDRLNYGAGQELRFLFLPTTTLVGNYNVSVTKYNVGRGDSVTQSLAAGIDQTLGPHLQGAIHAGAQFRSTEQENSGSFSPYFDSSLNYLLGEKTSLNWNVRYSIEESDLAGSSVPTSLRTGLGLSYRFTDRISANISATYVHDFTGGIDGFTLAQSDFSQDALDFSLGIQYQINSHLSANAGYHRSEVQSNGSQASYSRNSYSMGLSFSF